METSYPEIWIEGELASLSTPASGHYYFSLKDEQSQLRCAMFRNRAGISRYKPKAGDLVRVRAKISVYTARGDLQCIVQHIEEAGEGILQRRFEELKQALNEQGLFDQQHKQAIPSFPKHIGLITSPTGAAVKDILSTLKRRCPSIPVTIYPALVQGETAAKSLVSSLNDAIQHQRCDVIILSRGGGSLEDLWCFNDEGLARAIYACPLPVISGVGHEVDITIADLVADLRAPTPTAAAELLSPDTSHLLEKLNNLSFRLPQSLKRLFERLAQNIDTRGRQLVHPRQQLTTKRDQVQQVSQRLSRTVSNQLAKQSKAVQQQQKRFIAQPPTKKITQSALDSHALSRRLQRAQINALDRRKQAFNALGEQLNLVSPLATLERGFAIARDQNNVILRNASQAKPDQNIKVQLANGELLCTVLTVRA